MAVPPTVATAFGRRPAARRRGLRRGRRSGPGRRPPTTARRSGGAPREPKCTMSSVLRQVADSGRAASGCTISPSSRAVNVLVRQSVGFVFVTSSLSTRAVAASTSRSSAISLRSDGATIAAGARFDIRVERTAPRGRAGAARAERHRSTAPTSPAEEHPRAPAPMASAAAAARARQRTTSRRAIAPPPRPAHHQLPPARRDPRRRASHARRHDGRRRHRHGDMGGLCLAAGRRRARHR